MNLTKIFRIAAVSFAAALGFASPSQAAVTAFFSAGATCAGAASANFSTSGPVVTVSLCMTTTATPTATKTCGHTIVLQSAVGEGGRFNVVSSTLGASFSDPNSLVAPLPMAINNPPIVADLGGTIVVNPPTPSPPVAEGANILLATFNLAPQASALNSSYSISLNGASVVAVDAGDNTCGGTTVPTEAPISASFLLNRSNAPVFTSPASVTFTTGAFNTFTPSATGSPTPTITVSGTLPSGISFTGGALQGTPTSTGSFPLTFTATNATAATPQPFTLTVGGQASQTITFTNPGVQTFSSAPVPLSATGGASGNPVVFSSITLAVCTVTGSNVTMISLGTCTINANQAGNTNFLAASQVTQSFNIMGGVPGAPTIGTGTPGNGQATIAFTPPASSGGSVVTTYTVSCGGITASGNASPITVSGLTNGSLYHCSVAATNILGTGPSSATVDVTPAFATPLSLVGVVSRKVHGTAGTFSLNLTTGVPITGAVSVESRNIGTGHAIVFQFSETIASPGTVTAVDGASVAIANSVAFAGNEVTVTLTGVADRTRATVTLANVNGTGAGVTFPVSLGFLVGDQNGSYIVDAGDISAIRGRSGQAATALNFRGDFNASGTIDASDIAIVRGRSGNNLP